MQKMQDEIDKIRHFILLANGKQFCYYAIHSKARAANILRVIETHSGVAQR